MRQNLIIIFLLLLSTANLKASPQAPDYLIVGKDTIPPVSYTHLYAVVPSSFSTKLSKPISAIVADRILLTISSLGEHVKVTSVYFILILICVVAKVVFYNEVVFAF